VAPRSRLPSLLQEPLAFVAAAMDAGDAGHGEHPTFGQRPADELPADERPPAPTGRPTVDAHGHLVPSPAVDLSGVPPAVAGASPSLAGAPHEVRMDAFHAAAVAAGNFNPHNGMHYGSPRAGKRPAMPALGPDYTPPTPAPTSMERAIKNNLRAQSLAAKLVAADESTAADDRDIIGDYGTQSVYDLQSYYGPMPPPTPAPAPSSTALYDAGMINISLHALPPSEVGRNDAGGSSVVASQPRAGPPAPSKSKTRGKAAAKVSKPKSAPRVAARAKKAAALAASRPVDSDHLRRELLGMPVQAALATATAATAAAAVAAGSAPATPAATGSTVRPLAPQDAGRHQSPPRGCRPPLSPQQSPPSLPPPGSGRQLSQVMGSGPVTDGDGDTPAGWTSTRATPSGGSAPGAASLKSPNGEIFKTLRMAVADTHVPLAKALQGIARTTVELAKESAGTMTKIDTLGVSQEKLASVIAKMEQSHASVEDKLKTVISMISALDESDDSGVESTDSDGDSTMSVGVNDKKHKRRKSQKNSHRSKKSNDGYKNMDKVRRAFRRILMEHIGKTNITKLIYPDMVASWDLLAQAAQESLGVTAQQAKDYLMDYILVPTRADPKEAVSKRASVPLLRVKPHLMQTLKERLVMTFLRALGLAKTDMTSVLAGKWLDGDKYMKSALGFKAILEAVKELFVFLGATDRIIIAQSVGAMEVVECAVGHFALVTGLVRSYLELVAGVRSGRRNGVSEGMLEYWMEEVGRVDCFLPNDTFVHDGLRLLDGNDVGRAIFAVDEESMSDGIEA